ncbi:patatin-like phospholipase family protein [Bartonella sp. LJL80]
MRIGLALGGGGARGLGHLPVISALEDLGVQVNCVAGSSIGGLVGAGLASGMNAAELEDYFLTSFARSGDVIAKFWALKPTSWKDLWNRGVRLSQFDLETILESFLPAALPHQFSGLKLPLNVVAADLATAEMVVLNDGDLRPALAASAAIPGLFKPVDHQGRLFVDGGICNPVPFDCFPPDIDFSIGVDVVGLPAIQLDKNQLSTIACLMAASLVSQQALIAARLSFSRPDILLRPPVSGIYVLDFLKTKDILARLKPYKEEAKRLIASTMELRLRSDNNAGLLS